MTFENAYTSEINIGTGRDLWFYGFIWPIGFQTVFCGALKLLQRHLRAAKTMREQRADRHLDFLPYFKQNSSKLFI